MAGDAAFAMQLQDALDHHRDTPQEPREEAHQEEEEEEVDLAALQDVQVAPVGQHLPLATLVADYEGSPRVRGNLMPLLQRFPYFRRIKGKCLLLAQELSFTIYTICS